MQQLQSTSSIANIIDQHQAWRETTLNLIASENLISPQVRASLNNDLVGRYTDYVGRDLENRRYRGNRYVVELEKAAEQLGRQLFRASEVELRALSGHVAGACVIMGLCEAGDTILEVGSSGGSHRMAAKFAERSSVQLNVHFLPFDEERWNVDVPGTIRMIEEHRPRMVILGNSAFLFPHPIREIAAVLHETTGGILAYDASHVMGLLAGGVFQQPLEEGADVVYGSTHKTLPGPQGGVIYSNRADLMDQIAKALYPPLVTNHHSFRIPALALTFEEMIQHGAAYARQIVANAQALGHALAEHGLPPLSVDGVYSTSHTLLIPTNGDGAAAEKLEESGVICGGFKLPDAVGGKGLRIGTQEVTRMGAIEADMPRIAELMAAAYRTDSPREVTREVAAFVSTLPGLAFA